MQTIPRRYVLRRRYHQGTGRKVSTRGKAQFNSHKKITHYLSDIFSLYTGGLLDASSYIEVYVLDMWIAILFNGGVGGIQYLTERQLPNHYQ
jgi:hypothetical protein